MHMDRQDHFHSPTAANCPSLIDLAEYLDGRASLQAAEAVEFHLARCAMCLEAVREVQQMRHDSGHSLVLVPTHVIEQAMSLAPAPAVPQWWIATRRAAAVAAMLAVCAVGYQVGAAIAGAPSSAASTDATSLFFGLTDEDQLHATDDLLVAAEGKVL